MKAYRGSGSIGSDILKFQHDVQMSSHLHATAALPHGKSLGHAQGKKLGLFLSELKPSRPVLRPVKSLACCGVLATLFRVDFLQLFMCYLLRIILVHHNS